jgi:transposase
VSVEAAVVTEASGHWRKRTRRLRSAEERRVIVLASFAPGASIAEVARNHGVNANLLWNWRRQFKQAGGLPDVSPPRPAVDFVPIGMVVEAKGLDAKVAGMMELSLPGGARVTVDARVDEQALVRVLCALKAAA